ncbi:hypothetical protein A3I48_03125 [Candidatus Daviesbacteria bacterium RIFCSPLOWO2_02_FULL_36_7]|uniref:Peptidase A24A N-terminal domain-containing protein n=1 Tax=Candidatus Daviesbacteria bacterium RIFCSPLOWO2_02_FULL_36_7 TaxID=1797792 RepID=A0A1F5MG70_9BACT|nr:MAG: hypothetical protein A3I48_03125 [Candidatus Daviesbacteria bacterium RIFCSPLOWO2_02_FULL_36_7]
MSVIGFILGIILGSFAKALADRSLGKKSFWGRSYCPDCKHKLAWYDLFPILSYIILQGKCRYCKTKIGIEYVVVEVVMGLLIGFLFWQSFQSLQFTVYSLQLNFQFSIILLELVLKTFFIIILVVLFITDLKEMFIPDRIILPSIVIAVISLLAITLYKIGYLYYYLSQSAVGRLLLPPQSEYFQRHALTAAQPFFYGILMGALIGGFFLSLIIITRGKGMGGGDVKLGAFIGMMLGFPSALAALVLSFLTGAVFSVGLILLGKKHFGQTIPFGPFLVLGSLIMLFWGGQILDWYLHLGQ